MITTCVVPLKIVSAQFHNQGGEHGLPTSVSIELSNGSIVSFAPYYVGEDGTPNFCPPGYQAAKIEPLYSFHAVMRDDVLREAQRINESGHTIATHATPVGCVAEYSFFATNQDSVLLEAKAIREGRERIVAHAEGMADLGRLS